MRYALVYGSISGGVAIGVAIASLITGLPDHASSAVLGYLVMIVALSMIFVGMKRYRDIECGGVISFGQACLLGLGIALIAALIYVVGWEFYIASSGNDFMTDYAAAVLDDMHDHQATPAAIEAQAAQLRELAVKYRTPLFRLPITFVEIFPVGLVIALLSAAILRNPRVLPATQR